MMFVRSTAFLHEDFHQFLQLREEASQTSRAGEEPQEDCAQCITSADLGFYLGGFWVLRDNLSLHATVNFP